MDARPIGDAIPSARLTSIRTTNHPSSSTMATLKPPSTTLHRSSSTSSSAAPPRAPVKADSSATLADTAVFQGTHPITIGAGTVIHPRARFYSYEGPIVVGDGCIISEKAVIGAAPDTNSARSGTSTPASSSSATAPLPDNINISINNNNNDTNTTPAQSEPDDSTSADPTIRISYFVTIGPLSTIHPGAHIHSSVTIDSLATIQRNADVASHAKICSGCEVAQGGKVGEWVVVWGSGPGQRRRRARDSKPPCAAVVLAAQVAQTPVPGATPSGKVIEDARLMVLQKEREVLGRMIAATATAKKR